jgi:RNA polymerase sigma-70 factor (ECF subfamily)
VHAVERSARHTLLKVGSLTTADLADVVQDVFIRAFADSVRVQYDGRRGYGPFLLAIAHNIVIDWLRRSSREKRNSSIARHLTDGAFREQAIAGGDSSLYDSELVAIAGAYVRTLPDDLRALHHHRYVLDLPQRRAAEVLGISRQSLRTLEKKLIVGLSRELRQVESSQAM